MFAAINFIFIFVIHVNGILQRNSVFDNGIGTTVGILFEIALKVSTRTPTETNQKKLYKNIF